MSATSKPDCYDYVRRTYDVPAYIGTRVTVYGKPGVIVPARSDLHYIHVRFDGQRHSLPAHPTDEVVYAP
jgi:hypothetical protein